MTVIELPDEQATALKAKAAAQGLTLEAWLKRLADEEALSIMIALDAGPCRRFFAGGRVALSGRAHRLSEPRSSRDIRSPRSRSAPSLGL
jgi:hypothetical protein